MKCCMKYKTTCKNNRLRKNYLLHVRESNDIREALKEWSHTPYSFGTTLSRRLYGYSNHPKRAVSPQKSCMFGSFGMVTENVSVPGTECSQRIRE